MRPARLIGFARNGASTHHLTEAAALKISRKLWGNSVKPFLEAATET